MAVLVDLACEPGVTGGLLRIVDVKSGTVQLDRDALVQHPDFRGGGNDVNSLVLAPTGSAPWILCRTLTGPHPPCQVVDEIALGPNMLLDEGAEIDHKSLTLDGSTLSWRNNGETKTATSASNGLVAIQQSGRETRVALDADVRRLHAHRSGVAGAGRAGGGPDQGRSLCGKVVDG